MTARSVARSVATGPAGGAGSVAQFGAELITNGAFADASSWEPIVNWAIAAGVATHTAGNAGALAQILAAGRQIAATYRIEFTVTGYAAGQINLDLFDFGIPAIVVAGTVRMANGTYVQDVVAPASFDRLRIKPDINFAGNVDNVSLKRKFY